MKKLTTIIDSASNAGELERIEKNIRALEARPVLNPRFNTRSIKGTLEQFQKLRSEYSYSGPVNVVVPGCKAFTTYNNNDDNVAQTYFYFGEGSYESLSTLLFGALAKKTRQVLDVGGHTGLFSLIATSTNPLALGH